MFVFFNSHVTDSQSTVLVFVIRHRPVQSTVVPPLQCLDPCPAEGNTWADGSQRSTFTRFPMGGFDRTTPLPPVPEPHIVHSSGFVCISSVPLCPPPLLRPDAPLSYVTVVVLCPRMAHQAMNTSLQRRKGRNRFISYKLKREVFSLDLQEMTVIGDTMYVFINVENTTEA